MGGIASKTHAIRALQRAVTAEQYLRSTHGEMEYHHEQQQSAGYHSNHLDGKTSCYGSQVEQAVKARTKEVDHLPETTIAFFNDLGISSLPVIFASGRPG